MVDLENHIVGLYGNDLENHVVEVDAAIVKRCVKPKEGPLP